MLTNAFLLNGPSARRTAETIATSLGGHRVGSSWIAPCPAHDDRHPSLSLRDAADGAVLVHCHAGCDQSRVIDALRARGLWSQRASCSANALPRSAPIPPPRDAGNGDLERTQNALRLWQETQCPAASVVEGYLRARGITAQIPPTLRFHPGLKHPSGGMWPAMVALVMRGVAGEAVAIHRTFLTSDGNDKAPVEPKKMMLGPCRGGAVRLGPLAEQLLVGEGIETCLAAIQATRRPAWAALSTAGLRALDLPKKVRDVVILADGDEAGETAAQDTARRWSREGRRVRIARPPRGLDFNDVLLGHEGQPSKGAV